MEQGIPITLIPLSLNLLAPLRLPSPPRTIRASISKIFREFIAFSSPSSVINLSEREVERIVPPLWIMSATEDWTNFSNFASMRPS